MAKSSNSQASFSDDIDDAVLQELYSWVDQIPLSRPKKNLSRDFADGVLIAETIAHYFPKLVELHNYAPAVGTKLKVENWHVLNRKVFKKLHFELADDVIKQVVNCKPFVIERVLLMLRTKIDHVLWERQKDERPEVDQHDRGVEQVSSADNQSAGEVSNRKANKPPPAASNQSKKVSPATQLAGKSIKPAELVPRLQLEEKIQECLVKDETIQILEAKVRRLEHLLHLKDIRINDLQGRLDGIRPTGVR